ncbi:MAG: bifunctional glutamate N-acetyltransferase/amino-acid acetyltransferase ArgJ [Pseudomonadota bacterium]
MTNKISPLAPVSFPDLPIIKGVRLAAAESNIRYKNRPDLLLIEFDNKTCAAGVFTTSKTAAAPVAWCKNLLNSNNQVRGLIVNAGNANAFTGSIGMESVNKITKATAENLYCLLEQIFVASTGVIGEPLQDDKIIEFLPQLKQKLSPNSWHEAAQAIMTTDTFMKVATITTQIAGEKITINGIAKGSGMIAPNMATLLAFVFTDAKIPKDILQKLLIEANEISFNSITVDGDTSTNDTLLAFATGAANNQEIKSENDSSLTDFKNALTELLKNLAIQIVRDGEGATKLIKITVSGAEDNKAAKNIALTIANSPLVKTAIAGEDANWGRIVAAAGRAGESLVQEKLQITIGGVIVAQNGARVENYDETPVAKYMKTQEIDIEVELNLKNGNATIYTCDLTHGYIDINGSYRS